MGSSTAPSLEKVEYGSKVELSEEAPGVDAAVNEQQDASRPIVARFRLLGPFLAKLFDLGVEARGVDRVPENMRTDAFIWNNVFMWWSVNTVLSNVSVGILGQQLFGLTLPHAVATILSFGFIGSCLTAFVATLGPMTGLRTMIITRFSSGYLGGIIYSILNIITELGWAIVCIIVGGQTLVAVRPGTLSLSGGIVIIAVLSLIPCFIGYNFIHRSQTYTWIPLLIVMLCLWGLGAHVGFNWQSQKPLEGTGRALSANILSFGGIVLGSFTGWSAVAADYNCRLPVDTPSTKIFILTFIGIYIPTVAIEILGACLMAITDPAYTDAFATSGMGGLIAQTLSPWKSGGNFLLLILALSVLNNNILNTYSAGLSMQALGRPFAKLPRIFWTTLSAIIYTIAGIAGKEHFSEFLSNFLAILGFWTAWFVVILLEDHFIFRRKGGMLGGYNLDDWDSPSKLPLGVAGILAACFGAVGAVVGMSEVYYTGPVGKMAGVGSGADLGFELAFAFSAITYPPLRWAEIRYTGR